MANINVFSQLANRLSRFDRAVWEQLDSDVRQESAKYIQSDHRTRQKIVDALLNTVKKHIRTLKKIRLGREQEQIILSLHRTNNRIPSVEELKTKFEAVSEDFYHHYPTDKDELAHRLESGKFFQQGQGYWGVRLNTNDLVAALSRIACEYGENPQITSEALALAMLVMHPEWKDTKIAKAVGVSRTTLYDWPNFKKAKEALKQCKKELPKGSKNGETGDMEAWEADTYADT